MVERYIVDDFSSGSVQISDNVLATIAQVTASKVEGVVSMHQNLKDAAVDMLNNYKAPTKGVKINKESKEAIIDMYITVEYGKNIVDIAKNVQVKVKEAIENMTDITLMELNVHVSGISVVRKEA